MTVNIKISLGEQFQVDIKKNATIRKLKLKVKKLRGFPKPTQPTPLQHFSINEEFAQCI
jgi:hypothetical protein